MTGPEPEREAQQELKPITPLEMAQNAAAAVLRLADYQTTDPLGAHINRAGTQGTQSAELAGNMALVSIAESLDKLVTLALESEAGR